MSVPTAELTAPAVAPERGAASAVLERRFRGGQLYLTLAVAALVVGAFSLLLPSTPSYDPWAWLVWGREIVHINLHTTGGPTWKPLPVVFTTIGYEAGLKDGGLWLQKVPALGALQVGGRWVEIDPRLEPRADEPVVLKKGASGFFGTTLASILVSQGVDTVILCGATTSGCVRATAVDLLQYGWPTLVPRECVGDRSTAAHEQALADMGGRYGDVVSEREVTRALEEARQGTP